MTVLTGLRVVEIAGEHIAFAGKLLADMGADVILVEPPGGDPSRDYPPFLDDEAGEDRSLYWWHYHTSKRGVVLDLDAADGRDAFRRLIEKADILIESEPRARLSDLGIDYPQLTELKPDLIHVAMTPFGRDDSKSDLATTDLTIMAGGGPPWSCGYDDHSLPPVRGGGNQGYHMGCHTVVMSTLTAILYRGISGEGQFIDVSMHAAANVTTEAASYTWLVAERTVQRQTGRHAGTVPSRETQMLCADGRYANTGVPPRFPHEFKKLYDWLLRLDLQDDLPEAVFLQMGAEWEGPFDLSKIGEDDTLTAIFGAGRDALKLIASRLSAYDYFVGCQNVGLSVGVIYSPEEAFEDPHIKARGFQVEVEHEDLGRSVRYPGAPYHFEKTPWRISRRAPKLGEHNDEVFREIE
jgi:crotonobetainyl-CoA:carnitine CoA-transferase CaiB-like acyl-CoA transferase|tara:strand:+ start:1346 stop:2572 length:1227 start_codon:yes stop_codon:yes gene_type:complete